jgi:pimeloyl-ACP methyl ester carboxylesterase
MTVDITQQTVECSQRCAVEAQHLWSLVRDFCAPWHPAVESITPEYDDSGALVRALTVSGDDSVYKERLTYYSETDRTYRYSHIAGIADIHDYRAELYVEPDDNGCRMIMRATVSAAPKRADEVIEGTRAIFEAGIAAVTQQAQEQLSPAATTLREHQHHVPDTASPVDTGAVTDGSPDIAYDCTRSVGGHGKVETLLLFLHGIGGNRSNWSEQLEYLSSQIGEGSVPRGLQVAAIDLRGYGDSGLGESQSTIDDYCNDIYRVNQHFGAKKLILCGLSYGAWIATSFALKHPQMLSALVLSGGCTGMSEASVAEREAFRSSRQIPLDQGQVPADFAPSVVEILAGPQATDSMRKRLTDSMAAISVDTYRDALTCFTNPDGPFDFASLSIPVLMMTGEHDRLAPPDEIRSVAHRISQQSMASVRYETIAAAGHLCNIEQPDQYNRLLLEFINARP